MLSEKIATYKKAYKVYQLKHFKLFYLKINNTSNRFVYLSYYFMVMKEFYNSILVPTDFSEQSLVALEQSYNLAYLNNVNITLLHIIPETTGMSFLTFFSKVQSKLMTKQYYDDCMQKLQKIISKAAKKTKVNIYPHIETGKPYEKIVEISESIFAKYIIMGVNSQKPDSNKKSYLGSNAFRVVKEAKCPVITIKGKNFKNGCGSIVLPLDLTKNTKKKVEKAIELAKYYDATIKVFSAVLTDAPEVISQLSYQIQQVKNSIFEKSVVCTVEIRSGIKGKDTYASMILNYAFEVDADLIMIMTQQESDWVDFFVGSTAQAIISQSAVPVMSISPQHIA